MKLVITQTGRSYGALIDVVGFYYKQTAPLEL